MQNICTSVELDFDIDTDDIVEEVKESLDIEDMVRDALDSIDLATQVIDNLDFDTDDVASASDLRSLEERTEELAAQNGRLIAEVSRLTDVLVGIGAGLQLLKSFDQ